MPRGFLVFYLRSAANIEARETGHVVICYRPSDRPVDGQDRASIGHFAITPSYFPESTRSTRIGPARTTHRRREGDFAGKHRCGRPLAGDDHRPRGCPCPRTAASLPRLRAGSPGHPSSAVERRRAAGRQRLRSALLGPRRQPGRRVVVLVIASPPPCMSCCSLQSS
jgi:hypothetical protein